VLSVLSAAVLLERQFGKRAAPIDHRANLVGKPLALNGAAWTGSPTNVVIAVRSTCKFCAASMPFFRRLAEVGRNGAPMSLIAVSSEPAETTRYFLGKGGVAASQVFQRPLEPLGITATPTVLVADARGLVEKEYVGTLSPAQETELLAMVAGQRASPGPSRR
jgi:hypothetical protein